MKKLLLALACVSATAPGVVAVPASAATKPTQIWTNQTDQSQVFPTITASGRSYEIKFNIFSSVMGKGSTITGIKYKFGNYQNGYTQQNVQICIAPNNTQDWMCEDVSARPDYTSSYFKGLSAFNQVKMVVTLTGGTYPAQGGQPIYLEYGYTYIRPY